MRLWLPTIGLSPEQLSVLGKNRTTSKGKGRGKGLFLLQQYLSLFDGQIFFYSKKDEYFESRLVVDRYYRDNQ